MKEVKICDTCINMYNPIICKLCGIDRDFWIKKEEECVDSVDIS